MAIKRVFFDSGYVLIRPRSGNWFFPVEYYEHAEKHGLKEIPFRQLLNYRGAFRYLFAREKVGDEADEIGLFHGFYTRLFRGVKGRNDEAFIDLMADRKVRDLDRYEFYDDVREGIESLSKTYRIGIISDAWPTLRNVYKNKSMDGYFDPFVISTMHGCSKQNHDLFKVALGMVEEKPEEILFVDDDQGNCERARSLGMKALRMRRNGDGKEEGGVEIVRSLREVEEKLESWAKPC